jgi:hypothetical protein
MLNESSYNSGNLLLTDRKTSTSDHEKTTIED